MMAWERKKEAIEGREEVAVVETVCLARQLRPFGIKPATLRINYVPAKVTVSTISATSSNVTSQGPTSKPSPPNPATTTNHKEPRIQQRRLTEPTLDPAAQTTLHLAKVGNVILIGRGANIITAKLDGVFHVRLVAGLESRIRHIQEADHLGPKDAQAFVEREDVGRRRYLRRYYKRNIDDPLLYHLVINTDLMSYEAAASLIGECALGRFGGSRERPRRLRVCRE